MRKSILEAIEAGEWDYEPRGCPPDRYSPTEALPGSAEKVSVLRDRVVQGLPLWHPSDRRFLGALPTEEKEEYLAHDKC